MEARVRGRGRFVRGRRRGQALVEFALMIPIFLLLVFGVIEFGRALQAYLAVTDAAREAGRVAAAADPGTDSASTVALINQRLQENGLRDPPTTTTVAILPDGWPGASGDTVLVTIEYPFTFGILGVFTSWTGMQPVINLQTAMRFRNE